jgi:sporulation protein YlmC with PRC-barrel domain
MFTPDKEKTITKDRLVGMQVIDAEGNLVGTVRDVGFTVGKQGISIYVETSKGETKTIPWDDIQGAGDFVVLKSQHQIQQTMTVPQTMTTPYSTQSVSQPTAMQNICPTCGGKLTYIPQYQRWYCYKDKKYV